MKKKAFVWQFFDRTLLDDGVTAGVTCKLCTKSFKNHGNTTNLRSHISRVHPIQWDLATDGVLDDDSIRKSMVEDGTDNEETVQSARALLKRFRGNNSNDDDQSGFDNLDEHNIDGVHLVQQSDEEWLEEVSTYKPAKRGRKRQAKPKIKREVVSPTQFPSYPNFEDRQIIVASDSAPKDEYSVFGEYIGNKLRKFKSSRTRGNLQQLITTLLWQAEYGYFDNSEAVKRIILTNIQDLNTGDANASEIQNLEEHDESVIGN